MELVEKLKEYDENLKGKQLPDMLQWEIIEWYRVFAGTETEPDFERRDGEYNLMQSSVSDIIEKMEFE